MDINTETFPLFDAHVHFSQAFLDQTMASLNRCGVAGGIVIWGGGYPEFPAYQQDYTEFLTVMRARGLDRRFLPVYWPAWHLFTWQSERFVRETCENIRRYAEMGARGLKVWKDLGIFDVHADGSPAVMDDQRFEPIWQTCAELGWFISVHQADPSHGFLERSRTKITREEIFERRDRVIAAHPEITFILCHDCNYIEDLGKFAELLDRYPNVYSDGMCAGFYTLPGNTLAFLERYADRIMLGTDLAMPENRPPDANWNWNDCYLRHRRRLVGLGLTPSAFDKITCQNGRRLFMDKTPSR